MGGLAGAGVQRLRRRKSTPARPAGCLVEMLDPACALLSHRRPGMDERGKKRQRRLQDGGTERKRGSGGQRLREAGPVPLIPWPQERVQEQAEQSL